MLIALQTGEVTRQKAIAKGAEIAVHLGLKEGLVYPETLEQYFELVKSHKNSKRGNSHLIFARSHHELLRYEPLRVQRQAEHFFQKRGGSVWGENLGLDLPSYSGDLDNLDYLELQVKSDEARELHMRSVMPTQYYGRTQTDPHTFLIGIAPKSALVQNKFVGFIYEGMPEDWWNGVAFLPNPTASSMKRYQEAIEWFDINTVALGEYAGDFLTDLQIQHGTTILPREALAKKMTPKNYAILVRETARTQENNLSV